MNGTCETCKHWQPKEHPSSWGTCALADTVDGNPAGAGLLYAQAPGHGDAWLVTAPSFACNQHEET